MLGLCFLAFVLGFPSGVALTRFIGLQVGNLDFAECSRGVHLLDSCGVHFLFQHQRWNFEEKPSHTVWRLFFGLRSPWKSPSFSLDIAGVPGLCAEWPLVCGAASLVALAVVPEMGGSTRLSPGLAC